MLVDIRYFTLKPKSADSDNVLIISCIPKNKHFSHPDKTDLCSSFWHLALHLLYMSLIYGHLWLHCLVWLKTADENNSCCSSWQQFKFLLQKILTNFVIYSSQFKSPFQPICDVKNVESISGSKLTSAVH